MMMGWCFFASALSCITASVTFSYCDPPLRPRA
jgi:hypothetical protein